MNMTTRKDIEQVLWNACDSFRGKIDSSRYKDYILSMLFVKYLSDVSKEKREEYIKQYEGDMRRVERAMSRERFAIDEHSTFDYLYENRNDAEIGQKINVALRQIEDHNSGNCETCFAPSTSTLKWILANHGRRTRHSETCWRTFTISICAPASWALLISSAMPTNT